MPELDIELKASLDTLTAQLRRQHDHEMRRAQAIRQIPLVTGQMALNAGAGIIDDPAQLRCPTGYYMSVRRLTLSGFTAGTAVVCNSGADGEPLVPFSAAGSATFGRGELLLHPGDRLVVTAAGITGYVQLNGAADLLESWYLPYYIG